MEISWRDSPRRYIINYIFLTMNVSRKLPGGERIDEERVNKSQIYVNFFGQNVTIFVFYF